jgi:hypothetical protein
MLKKLILIVLAIGIGGFLLIQLVPYGKGHTNPPVVQEPAWDTPATRELAKRACFDCHSNETIWPWYTNIAPISWLVAHDTYEGRDNMNFSEWTSPQVELRAVQQVLLEDAMPPAQYKLIHKAARLTDAERAQLNQGLQVSLH